MDYCELFPLQITILSNSTYFIPAVGWTHYEAVYTTPPSPDMSAIRAIQAEHESTHSAFLKDINGMMFHVWSYAKIRRKIGVSSSSLLPTSRQPYKPIHEWQPVCKSRPIDHAQILASAKGLDRRRRCQQVRLHTRLSEGTNKTLIGNVFLSKSFYGPLSDFPKITTYVQLNYIHM